MPSSEDKVIQFHISRLKDKNPEVLVKTIKELMQFGAKAQDALPILEDIFKTSEDIEVKAAAQQAGLIIYREVQKTQGDEE